MDPLSNAGATPAPAAASTTKPAAPAIDRDSPTWKAAQEFEAVFLGQMLAQMYQGIEAKAPFGGGFAEETYRSLMHQEIGRQMATTGGVGIAESVYAEMIRMQGNQE
jgi:Rod binding domain-containing protein